MSSAYSQEIETLLDALMRAERHADLVRKFADTGGEHRIRITIEHPDYDVREAVEMIANQWIPKDLMIRGFEKFSKEAVDKARINLASTAITSDSRSAA
jgi:hypothetical protein